MLDFILVFDFINFKIRWILKSTVLIRCMKIQRIWESSGKKGHNKQTVPKLYSIFRLTRRKSDLHRYKKKLRV